LLGYMEPISEEMRISTKSRAYPKGPSVLTKRLNEIKPTLEEIGITITKGHDSKTKLRFITICKVSSLPYPASPDKNQAQITSDFGDSKVTVASPVSSPNEGQN